MFSKVSGTTLELVSKLAKEGQRLAEPHGDSRVWYTHTHRNCIVTEWEDKKVTYIALGENGFRVQTVTEDRFLEYYRQAPFDSRVAAQVYQFYLAHLPTADQAVKSGLAALSTGKLGDIAMARKSAAVVEEFEDDQEDELVEEQETPKAKRGKAAKPTAVKADRAPRERGETAAKMFQDLIMEGKLTDEKIFEKVAAKYNLDDNKRSYVKWYRNYLTKRGQNPPPAKVSK